MTDGRTDMKKTMSPNFRRAIFTSVVLKCYNAIMHPKDADGTSVDPDRTAPSSPIWVCTICIDFYTLR